MSKKKLLFVCVENSNRSQMSQAFAIMQGGENVVAVGAGSGRYRQASALVGQGDLGARHE